VLSITGGRLGEREMEVLRLAFPEVMEMERCPRCLHWTGRLPAYGCPCDALSAP